MSKEKKPKPVRKSRKKATRAVTEEQVADNTGDAPLVEMETPTAAPRAKRAPRRPARGTRSKRSETEANLEAPLPEPEVDRGMEVSDEPETGAAGVDAPPPRSRTATPLTQGAPGATIELTAPNAVVEKKNDTIVIRFPPAGVPTLPSSTPAARSGASQPPPARPVPAETPRQMPRDQAHRANQSERPVAQHAPQRGQQPPRGKNDRRPDDRPPKHRDRARGTDRAEQERPQQRAQDRPAARPPGNDPFAGLTEEEFRKLSPSQKRRLRRKRRFQNRETQPGSSSTELDALDSSVELAEPTQLAAETPPLQDEMDDESVGSSHIETEWGDELEGAEEVETQAPTGQLVEIDDEDTDTEEESDARRERRGRRGRRGRRSRPRRGDGERSEAAERVYGDENADVIEIGEDLVTAMARERAAEVTEDGEEDDLGHVVAPGAPRREMIINIIPRDECRIAVLNESRLEEIYIERASAENHVGNIYKGIVTNVEPSIQAAFIDFGMGKNGFLHISDLHPKYFPAGGRDTENVGRKMPRRHRPPIQRCLRRNQELLVQITKEGIGTKGPTLTTYLSIPGRFLVMMPGMSKVGVSRKVEDEDLRRDLRGVLSGLQLPGGMGFIARTAAVGRTTREVQSDLNYLSRLWRAVERRIQDEPAPAELYRESDLVIRTIRDIFSGDIHRIVVDDREVAERARQFLSIFSPRSRDAVIDYNESAPIFHHYNVEAELERLHSKHVSLPSGGSLIIEQTEALVAIDVNSGRYRTADDAETTAFKINLEATDEISRQLRLRDLGGLIICDFIDMRDENHRREVERRLIRNLKYHKERAKILRMSQFGIIEMTRQRQRASFTRSVHQPCPNCRGTSMIKTAESVAIEVMRTIQLAVTREAIQTIEVSVAPDIAHMLLNRKRAILAELETRFRRTIYIKPDPHYAQDQVQIQCTDNRGRLIPYQ
ncbi:MAG: Rne/Rng family ribonuclease [Phycisphaerales bacterium]|nr:Rne/Rng family ribonuclease [Phycisphaerales bacterium]